MESTPKQAARRLYQAMLVSAVAWTVSWLALPAPAVVRRDALDVLWTVLVGLAGLLCLAAAAVPENRRLRRSLRALGGGSLAWALGQAVWTYYELFAGRETPYPSLADIGYLLAMPLLGLALVFWPRHGGPRPVRRLVEAGLAAGAASLAAYVFLISPAVATTSSGWMKVCDIVYPISEFGVAAIVAGAALLDDWAERDRLFLLLGGLATLAITDAVYDHIDYTTGSPLDFGWTVAFVVIALVAAPPRIAARWRNARFPGWAWVVLMVTPLVAVRVDTVKRIFVAHGSSALVESIATFALIVVLVGRFMIVNRQLGEQMELSARAHEELRAHEAREREIRDRFLAEVVSAREDEARRVAGLLHDDAVQRLTALGLRLELAERRIGEPEVGRLAREAREITRALRRLMTELYPAVLEGQGVAAAVELAAEGLREQGVAVRVTPCEARAPAGVEEIAYRVVVEGLANVAKHARATNVEVEISIHGSLSCAVSDDGVGFDGPSADTALGRGSLGLHLARQRVQSVGGDLWLRSSPGRGTVLRFELPLPPAARDVRVGGLVAA